MKKVIVGMSGGVDSAAAACILKEKGYDVTGVTLRTWESEDGEYSRCCEIDDAREAARVLGIPFRVLNCVSDFKEKVTEPFIRDYIRGRTPNPCVICNRAVKWEWMTYAAGVLGADYIATGHYARIEKLDNGRYTVRKAAFSAKDQTYMLYRLSQEDLKKTLMPLGNISKDEARGIVRDAGIRIADKPDSQEICFVNEGVSYGDFIEKNAGDEIPPPGNFVDPSGNILGRHRGIIHYTVGQRKGLGLPLGYPAFIKKIDADTNEIIVTREEELYSDSVFLESVNFMSVSGLKSGESLRAVVKVRYHHGGQEALIEGLEDGRVKVDFDAPVRAAAPGQSAVFYDDDNRVIGGGIIT